MNDNIKVSTITITRNRLNYLKECIEYYKDQCHTNKEMMILYYDDDEETKTYLTNLDPIYLEYYSIRILKYKQRENIHLGALRNYLIKKATGEYIIIWDDDDYYAPTRISEQLAYCVDNDVVSCTLSSLLLYSDKQQEIKESVVRSEGWEGSLMCKRSEMPAYSNLGRYEDTPVLQKLIARNNLDTYDNPDLYVYRLHDSNTSVAVHKEHLFDSAKTLSGIKNLEYKQKIGLIK